jgi:hypothetical protein
VRSDFTLIPDIRFGRPFFKVQAGAIRMPAHAFLKSAPSPLRHAKEIESLVLFEGLPRFLAWLRWAELTAVANPKDVLRWSADVTSDGKLVYSSHPTAP